MMFILTCTNLNVPGAGGAVSQQRFAQVEEDDGVHGGAEHLAEQLHCGVRGLRDVPEAVVGLQ